ncbi:MAG: transglutaminase family protein [Hyphomicrobiaceae bacterium]
MLLKIVHRTTYDYAPAALRVVLRLRLFPSECDGQSVKQWSVRVNGEGVDPIFTDGFGDRICLWATNTECEHVEIIAEGVVDTADAAGVLTGLLRRPPPNLFLRETHLTASNCAIAEFANRIRADTPLARMHALSHAVRQAIAYTPGATHALTPATTAFELGKGVCQDHSHVFIAAVRCLGIPARYVSGYILTEDEISSPQSGDGASIASESMSSVTQTNHTDQMRPLRGSSESSSGGPGANEMKFETSRPEIGPRPTSTHAWTEVHIPNLGWVGFDPTHAICPTDRYVRLSAGLDADAVAPVLGAISGEAIASLTSDVIVCDATKEAPQILQSQQ